ncbi:hypothetical protein Mp_7g07000 [Marchantia polymorpha subsp. ruderalis]|uniref:Uncharacterized protein n=2 Tax=Marchantia polymorpha TaxID=3197 RepID=A0AAF6BWY1_MARPO|nr:hypothetical protein MARPO_0076s0094 [Marchantia polymorpha]BBN16515.1 hypothetical protein Mp_7g07000 [Marchantia polymorpha subsp. ruderalis]|eukprot:PTQ34863.1 hypothetical protein MARPO_0076s0094 [Marchantia polymorpha]
MNCGAPTRHRPTGPYDMAHGSRPNGRLSAASKSQISEHKDEVQTSDVGENYLSIGSGCHSKEKLLASRDKMREMADCSDKVSGNDADAQVQALWRAHVQSKLKFHRTWILNKEESSTICISDGHAKKVSNRLYRCRMWWRLQSATFPTTICKLRQLILADRRAEGREKRKIERSDLFGICSMSAVNRCYGGGGFLESRE